MKRSYRVMFSALLLSIAAFSAGCGKACKDLEDVCNRCEDANIQAACQSVVDADDQDGCAESVAGFEAVCP